MAFRLLPKSEILEAKNKEREMEIREGAKLAKKIDVLRQTSAQEEQTFTKFRLETLKSFKEEMEKLKVNRDAIQGEVKDLEERKQLLQVPLDEEWAKVNAKAEELKRKEEELAQNLISFFTKKEDYDKKVKELSFEEARINQIKKKTMILYEKAEENEVNSQKLLLESHSKSKEIALIVVGKSQELLSREAEIASKERGLEIEREHIEKEKKEIIRTKLQLADQRGTLERAMKRIK